MSNTSYEYQYNYADDYNKSLYDIERREIKARKVISILHDYLRDEQTCHMKLLDVGCSTGIQTGIISEHFGETIGIDIDENAVLFAQQNFQNEKVRFLTADNMNIPFEAECFDLVICTHVYEHVPDPERLMREIYRVLKPEGICYFAAGNKYNMDIIEPHYRLAFLSWLPKSIANRYVRLAGKAKKYYENLYPLSKLRSLTSSFLTIDYTVKVLQNPEQFYATDMIKNGTVKYKIALFASKYLYTFIPTYIWLLRKHECQ